MKTPTEEDINNVLAGKSTPEIAKNVAAWFATPHGAAYLASCIEQDFNETELPEASPSLCEREHSQKLLHHIQAKIQRKRIILRATKIAAVLVPFLFVLTTFLTLDSRLDLFSQLEYEEIYVPKGQEMQIIFQDGSKVFLDSDSRLRYPRKFAFNKRNVYLDGQGYFEVNSDKSWPFIVNMAESSIKVLGTSFNVNAYSNEKDIIVQLDEGEIQMTTYSDNTYDLVPGDILTFNKSNKVCSIRKVPLSSHQPDWMKNILTLHDASLQEVVRKLNREFNIDFVIEDSAAWQVHYTIDIDIKSLASALTELEDISLLKFNLDQQENKVFVKSVKK